MSSCVDSRCMCCRAASCESATSASCPVATGVNLCRCANSFCPMQFLLPQQRAHLPLPSPFRIGSVHLRRPTPGEDCLTLCPIYSLPSRRGPAEGLLCLCALPTLDKQITALSTGAMLSPVRSCSAHITDPSTYTSPGHSICPPKPRFSTADSSTIACKTHSSVLPNWKGFLQRAVSKPPRPDQRRSPGSFCCRGASDTVLGVEREVGQRPATPGGGPYLVSQTRAEAGCGEREATDIAAEAPSTRPTAVCEVDYMPTDIPGLVAGTLPNTEPPSYLPSPPPPKRSAKCWPRR
jgi:hypothetical protein